MGPSDLAPARSAVALLLLLAAWIWLRTPFSIEAAPGVLLSQRPLVTQFPNFLSPSEVEHLLRRANSTRLGRMATVVKDGAAAVLESVSGKTQISRVPSDDILRDIEQRIAGVSGIPATHGERFALTHYRGNPQAAKNYFFRGHLDAHVQPGLPTSSRVATFLIYLSTVQQGGETFFPFATNLTAAATVDLSCAELFTRTEQAVGTPEYLDATNLNVHLESSLPEGQAMIIRPEAGMGVLWWNQNAEGVDYRSQHGGCPMVQGPDKWILTKWIHNRALVNGNHRESKH